MNTAVMSRRARQNMIRKTDLRRPVSKGEVIGGVCCSVGRGVSVLCSWTLMIVFMAVVSAGILFAYRWVTTHEFFQLKTLTVQGEQRLSPEEITLAGGVDANGNLLDINIADVQRRIAALEWIESVSVTRILPDALTIEIKERVPYFLIRREDQLFYADSTGQAIAPVGVEKFISLPVLEKEDGVPLGPGIEALMEEISRNTLPFGMRHLAWVRQDSAEQFSLFLERPRVHVQVDGTDLHATLACLTKLWADLEHRQELDAVTFMFVTPTRAWIRFKADQT
ncbi:MAG: FtsQ-type POTRA domain-containing protein [Desulfovibrionales bacterium]|nr:FtsQ-type POTRA domain-containing protein [Desulfovibrionales bacterium]